MYEMWIQRILYQPANFFYESLEVYLLGMDFAIMKAGGEMMELRVLNYF